MSQCDEKGFFTYLIKDKWTHQLDDKPGDSIEIFSDVSLCTMDIILRCAFTYNENIQLAGYMGLNRLRVAYVYFFRFVTDAKINIYIYIYIYLYI